MNSKAVGAPFAIAVAASIVALATPAFAHVDPSPLAMQAGTTATIAFNLEHGCGDSPTTSLAFRLPDGVTNPKPVDKSGWTTSVAGNVVTFSGGSLDAHTEDHFDISLTAPKVAGTVYVPVDQKCAKGENAWIEIPKEGGKEPDYPAAALKVTTGPPTADDLKPAEEDADSGGNSGTNVAIVVAIVVAVLAATGGLGARAMRKPKAE